MTEVITCDVCNPDKEVKLGFLVMEKEIINLKKNGLSIESIGALLCLRRSNYTMCIEFKLKDHIDFLYKQKIPNIKIKKDGKNE